MSYTVLKQANPSSGNKRVWVACTCGRKFTARAAKVKSLPACKSRAHSTE